MAAAGAKLHLLSICFLILLDFPTNAVSKSIVRYLPGFDGPLPFELETGYVKVDDYNGVHLFYYFFKSENNPIKDPLLIWFSGGPGCSGLNGLFFEIGPLKFKGVSYDGTLPGLVLNPISWTKASNILFLDAPVGTGFSFSRTSNGYQSSDTKSAKQSYTFIRKWLVDHPEFISNPLYVGGDSYAGMIVPIIVQHIADSIESGDKPLLNFKGYLLGNPVTDRHLEMNAAVQYAYGMGFLSDELYEAAKRDCRGEYVNVDPKNIECRKHLKVISGCTERINKFNILEPMCDLVETNLENFIRVDRRRSLVENQSINSISPDLGSECNTVDSNKFPTYWANDHSVQQALNVQKGISRNWLLCNDLGTNYLFDVESSIVYHSNISKRPYRSLIYSGDHDFVVPYISTQAWIRSLNYSITHDWRPWLVNNQIAGYTRTYANNMTFATVKDGGHTAPEFKPDECLVMFKRWLSEEPL